MWGGWIKGCSRFPMRNLAPNIPNPESTRVFRVGTVQMIFAESMAANLGKIERAATAAARKGADAVLFPECATTGYALDFGNLKPSAVDQALNAISQLAADLRVQLLVGSPVFRSGRLYNALLVFNRSGRLVHAYSKCQLTPADRQWFSAGEDISLFELDGIPASTFICHERRYPELPRISAMAGARIVFHPNAGMDSLAVSRKKRGGGTGWRSAPSRMRCTMSLPIRWAHKGRGNGRLVTRRSCIPVAKCFESPTIRTKRP